MSGVALFQAHKRFAAFLSICLFAINSAAAKPGMQTHEEKEIMHQPEPTQPGYGDEIDMHIRFLLDPFGDEPHRRQHDASVRFLVAHSDQAYPRLLSSLRANPTGLNAPPIIEVLPLFHRPESIPLLKKILFLDADQPSEVAGKALGYIPEEAAKAALLAGLASENPHIVSAAADGLLLRGDHSVCEELKRKLNIHDSIARDHVRQAITRLGCPAAVNPTE